jgi:glucose-6-phosphate 1-dehydrogenase
MRKISNLDKMQIYENDHGILEDMVKQCNLMIDQLASMEDPESQEAKDLKVNILNYKNKIAKIRKGY